MFILNCILDIDNELENIFTPIKNLNEIETNNDIVIIDSPVGKWTVIDESNDAIIADNSFSSLKKDSNKYCTDNIKKQLFYGIDVGTKSGIQIKNIKICIYKIYFISLDVYFIAPATNKDICKINNNKDANLNSSTMSTSGNYLYYNMWEFYLIYSYKVY